MEHKRKWAIKPLKNGKSKVFVSGKDFRGNKCDYDIATCQNMANANLIASAPDTYKVAKDVVDYVETNGVEKWSNKEKEDSFIWALYNFYAKDAVAKAEGK
jgi:hypothetical protein